MSESKKRVNGRQTAGQAVIRYMRSKGATDPEHAIGYDQLKNISLTTQVLAYTIANMMEEKVIVRTENERYYFDEAAWAKLERKVLASYYLLFLIPVVGALIFWMVSKVI